MKQTLQLKLSQHLTLTPQLQQSIRLLQLSTIELNQEIEQMLAENPLLEREEGFEPADGAYGGAEQPRTESINDAFGAENAAPDGEWGEALAAAPGTPRSDDDEDAPTRQVAAAGESLREHLAGQLALTRATPRDRGLVTALIEALDEDGYLDMGLEEILAMLPEELAVDIDELGAALKLLQSLEPAGVGARSLPEVLELQMRDYPADAVTELARRIVREFLPALADRDFGLIRRECRCSESDLKAAREIIVALNPRPGAQFNLNDTRYVTPDVIVRKIRSTWRAAINPDAVPRLRINRMYAEILARERTRGASAEGATGMATQLQEAKWLLKNVQQRFETIGRVAQAIVDRQRHFLDHGEVAMRPLVLREIADELGLHESTISRVTTSKYMLTPKGLFELKYFFGSHVATDSGGACSSTAIRALIKQLVSAEDVKRPLSDSKIAEILGQQGIVVARRTIAKYRDALKIAPANMRKTI
ncbi:MAG: RNA polymerase factor sigma-54 [Burkholderiales bacterium]|nr:RNA polymerase factor sigma-54 [Burkholderiales bacterium]